MSGNVRPGSGHRVAALQDRKNTYSQTAYISYLNVISAMAVVILHANDAVWSYRSDGSWLGNHIIECVFYYAVPIFFMLTGATLIDYPQRYDTRTFFIKRFQKTVIPFLFWSFVPFLLSLAFPQQYRVNTELSFQNFFNGVFNYYWFYWYWFFIPLFCIYLTMPLLAFVKQEKKIKVFSYIAAVAFVINVCIPFIIKCVNLAQGTQLDWRYSIVTASNYMLFVLAGYVFHKIEIPVKYRVIIYVLSLAGLLTHIIGTNWLTVRDGKISDFFKGYENLPCILYSLGIFVFVKYAVRKITCEKLNRFIFFIQKYTLEMYLMHRLILPAVALLLSAYLPFIGRFTVEYTFVMTLILIPLCLLITFLLRKIPIVKHIVP